jgi:uncharacterized protein YndB with AHSA1/START domain
MDGLTVPVAVVASRTEAELIAGLLRSNGLSAAVSADDAGGQDPQLQLEGVRVLVAPADETLARQLLAAPETPDARIVGTLRIEDGKGVVRMEDRFDTDIDDLWSAFTDRGRLARWLGEFEGDLRLGGEFRARFFSSGWEGTGRVDVCEPPRHLLVTTRHARQTDEHAVEATLTADGEQTILILEQRGMPVNLLAAYGAGIQVHIEDLAAHIAGRERCDDPEARWEELHPSYEALASKLG